MISEAFCTATCDHPGCQFTEDVLLKALDGEGEYDMCNVTAELECNGWYLVDGIDGVCFCPDHHPGT